jgi:hypothetical protein
MSWAAAVMTGVLVVTALPAGPPGEPPTWLPGEHGAPDIQMSIENWGDDVDISTASVAYAHLGANGPTTKVKVAIEPPSSGMHGFYGRLTAPDAFGGELKLYCGDEYRRIDLVQFCFFEVPMSGGPNRLVFDLQSASWEGIVSKEGTVTAGRLGMVSVLEASLPYRNWALVPTTRVLELRGEQTSSLRYRIMNTGDLPFRVPESCDPDGTVWPLQQLLCPVRDPRPVYALAGDYSVPVQLVDPVGGGASFTIDGHLRVKGIDSVVPISGGLGRNAGARR